jgi:parvulin-like peptidyl-prolyl isomerase
VARHTEGHSGDRHGFVAPFTRGSRPRSFEDAVFPLEVGEIAGPIESPFGFHVVIREVGETYTAAQIVIGYEGAQGATGEAAARSRSEAISLVARLRARVVEDPDSFGMVAREFTDGPRKQMGGNVGTFNLYTYGRFFGEVVADLRPGEISEVFETRQGFNIVKRTR